jgi:predicted type IV restriction endonuclease
MAIPTRVADRLASGLKRFQTVLLAAKARDVNESDTSMIVTDLLAEMFGFDKYTEITRELAIRGTFCDLATKIDGKVRMLIEVKAIGLELKEAHSRQAVDYAANSGIEWIAVTNGLSWRVFKVIFGKPVDQELVLQFNMSELNSRTAQDIESLFLLTRESAVKSALDAYHDRLEATNRFFLAAIVVSDPVLEIARRELRRVSPDVKVEIDELRSLLTREVLKRDVIEGDKADHARKKIARAATKLLRVKKSDEAIDEPSLASAETVRPPEISK